MIRYKPISQGLARESSFYADIANSDKLIQTLYFTLLKAASSLTTGIAGILLYQ